MSRNDFSELVNSNLQKSIEDRTYRTFRSIASYASQKNDGLIVSDSLELDILRSSGLIEYKRGGWHDSFVYGIVYRATLTAEGLFTARSTFPELYQQEKMEATE